MPSPTSRRPISATPKRRRWRSPSASARRRASMSSGSTFRAIRSPATRWSAANSASTRAMRSTPSGSSARRTGSSRSASSRTSSRSSRPRARLRTASSCRVDVEEKADRPASAFGRLLEPREVHPLGFDRPDQLHGQGPGAQRRRSIIRAIRSRSQLGFVEPYLFDRSILLGGDIYRRDYNSFNYATTATATRPIRSAAPAAACALGFPITEFVNFGTRYSLVLRQDHARRGHVLQRSRRRRSGRAECSTRRGRPISVR